MIDLDVIDNGVKCISDFGEDDLMPHFIYCGFEYFVYKEQTRKLRRMFLTKMRKYGIQSSILTMLYMRRLKLVTKEKVKKAAEGKLKNEPAWAKESINDHLERFLINLQKQKEVKYEHVYSFFTPKLTNEELKLVEEANKEHLKTYLLWEDDVNGLNPDVDVEEMKKSDSKSKYVHGRCWRKTIPLTLATEKSDDYDKTDYFSETDDSSSETSWSD